MKGDCHRGKPTTPWGPFVPDYSFYCCYYIPSSWLPHRLTCCWTLMHRAGELEEQGRHPFSSLMIIPITIQFQSQDSPGGSVFFMDSDWLYWVQLYCCSLQLPTRVGGEGPGYPSMQMPVLSSEWMAVTILMCPSPKFFNNSQKSSNDITGSRPIFLDQYCYSTPQNKISPQPPCGWTFFSLLSVVFFLSLLHDFTSISLVFRVVPS